MNSLIPGFIQEQLDLGRSRGDFHALCMSLDLVGFTAATEDLMEQGTEGAEELSRILSDLFGSLVATIYSFRGYITSFAGDALTALFPGDDPRYAAAAARQAQSSMVARRRLDTRFGRYRVAMRLGVGAGPVRWGTVGTPSSMSYYFSGPAIDRAVGAQAASGEGAITLDGETARLFAQSGLASTPGPEGFFTLAEGSGAPGVVAGEPRKAQLKEADLLRMFPREVVAWSGSGEFRRIAVLFLSFASLPEHGELNRMVTLIRTKCDELGGYFNLLDYGDKGLVILILFGAPVAHEDDLDRATDFALAVVEELGEAVRCGMAVGTAYAGLVGSAIRSTYTALGATVNLAARIAQSGAWGTLTVSEATKSLLGRRYGAELERELKLKGIARPVAVFTVTRAKASARVGARGNEAFAGGFVGRESELADLARGLRDALSRKLGGVTYVYGEAGSGKSRLVHEALAALGTEVRTFSMTADPILCKSMNPFTKLLGEYFLLPEAGDERATVFAAGFERLLGGIGEASAVEALERYRPFIAALLGVHVADSLYTQLDPQARFENTIYAIAEFFRAHCLRSPILLRLEDAHSLDEDSRRALLYLSRNLTGLAARLVVTSRFDDEGGKPAVHSPEVTEVAEILLRPLARGDVERLLAARLGGRVAPQTLEVVYAKSEGNPYYVEQLAGYLLESGRLKSEDGRLTLGGSIQEIPNGINAILVARLDRLSPALKSVAQVACVFGSEFPTGVLREMMDSSAVGEIMRSTEVDRWLDVGCRQRLWQESGEGAFAFQSTLLRDTAYEMQSRERLRRLHGVVAYAMEDELSSDETRLADLAYHFERGGVQGRAAHYLRDAAESAAAGYRNEEAIELFSRLLDRVDPHERIAVELRIAEVCDLHGDIDGAIMHLERALETAKSLARKREEPRLLVREGEIFQKKGDYAQAESVLRAAVAQARRLGDQSCYGRALLWLGRTYWSIGKYDPGIKLLDAAVDVLTRIADEDGVALALYYTGVMYRDKTDYAKANDYYRKSEELFRRLGNRRLETYPLYDLAVIYLYRGELASAFESFAQVEAVYREMGYKSGLAAALGNLGVVSAFRGDFDRAQAYGGEAFAIVKQIGEQLAVAYATFNLGLFRYLQGNHGEAALVFARALDLMRKIGAEGYYGYAQSYLACSLAFLDRREESLLHSRDHLARIAASGSDVENGRTLLAVALVLSRAGDALVRGPGNGKQVDGGSMGGRPANRRLVDGSRSGGNLPEGARRVLAEIGGLSDLAPQADAYFEASIERAAKASYIATLLPAYVEFGAYLLRGVDGSAGVADRAGGAIDATAPGGAEREADAGAAALLGTATTVKDAMRSGVRSWERAASGRDYLRRAKELAEKSGMVYDLARIDSLLASSMLVGYTHTNE